jgi:hypothetical protein
VFGRKKNKPTAEQLVLRDDIQEARQLQAAATGELDILKHRATLFTRLTAPLIDRQGQNHYIETLYHFQKPRKAS